MLRLSSIVRAIRPTSSVRSNPIRTFAVLGKKRDSHADRAPSSTSGHWSEVALPDLGHAPDSDKNESLKGAKDWVSVALSDDEASFLNKKLGIKDKDLRKSPPDSRKKLQQFSSSRGDFSRESRQQDLPTPTLSVDEVKLRDLRGFLQLNPFICSGCGSNFQTHTENHPGFLPKEKFVEHHAQAELIRKQQEAIKILEMSDVALDSPAAEEYLRGAEVPEAVIQGVKRIGQRLSRTRQARAAQQAGQVMTRAKTSAVPESELGDVSPKTVVPDLADLPTLPEVSELTDLSGLSPEDLALLKLPPPADLAVDILAASVTEAVPSPTELDDSSLEPKVCICQRCFRLQQYGQVESSLRPGWSENDLLTPERFETLLGGIQKAKTVVLSIVDIFDLEGSVVPNLKAIAGDNPVIIAANKADLLPTDVSESRLINYLYGEVKSRCRFVSPADYALDHRKKVDFGKGVLPRGHVQLISCNGGYGLEKLMSTLVALAKENGNSIHVLGAANAGKSSFINRLLQPPGGKKSGKKASSVPLVTVSNLPGTTLDFLKIKLPNGITVVDTPGLINKGHITSKLTTEELKEVIPSKALKPVTLRLEEGRCILLGGLARIELTRGRPMFFTVFASSDLKLHVTDPLRADAFLEKHVGGLIFPPHSLERLQALGPMESKQFEVDGLGWQEARWDVVVPGVGWVSVTGVGSVTITVTAPQGTGVGLRPALLPFEAQHSTAKFTGGRIEKKSIKRAAGPGNRWTPKT